MLSALYSSASQCNQGNDSRLTFGHGGYPKNKSIQAAKQPPVRIEILPLTDRIAMTLKDGEAMAKPVLSALEAPDPEKSASKKRKIQLDFSGVSLGPVAMGRFLEVLATQLDWVDRPAAANKVMDRLRPVNQTRLNRTIWELQCKNLMECIKSPAHRRAVAAVSKDFTENPDKYRGRNFDD
jgi:hypothetical protein